MNVQAVYNSRAMQPIAEQIRQKLDIVQYIGQYVQLKKTGRNYKGLCPFHQEKSPSFIVSPERQIWHCFGSCGQGGDIIAFIMKYDNLTFPEAVRELAKQAGVTVPDHWSRDGNITDKEAILTINARAAQYYHYVLEQTAVGKETIAYLNARAIRPEIRNTFELGYAPTSWDSLCRYLLKKNFSERLIIESGLGIKGKSGTLFDRFRGRLMFPIKNMQGRVIGFSGRILKQGKEDAKYINTSETVAYHKRESLFGIHIAKDAIRKQDGVVLVEGEFDMITPYQHGFTHFVAIKGSAVTREQLLILKRLTTKVYLCLDADSAGIEATKRAIAEAEGTDMEIHVIRLTVGKDPDEAVRHNLLAFKHDISHSIAAYDFLIDAAVQKYTSDDPFHKKHIADDVVPLVSRIKNPIIQSYYVKKLSTVLDVSEESVLQSISDFLQKQKIRLVYAIKDQKPETHQSREELIEEYLLSILLQDENPYAVLTAISQYLSASDFQIGALGKIYAAFITYKSEHAAAWDVRDFIDHLAEEIRIVADRVFLFASSTAAFNTKDTSKMAIEIRRNALRRLLKELSRQSEQTPEIEKHTNDILRDLKWLEKKLSTV